MTKIDVKLPVCCSRPMKIKTDMGRFWEVQCGNCGDIVYIKKEMQKPQLVDD